MAGGGWLVAGVVWVGVCGGDLIGWDRPAAAVCFTLNKVDLEKGVPW